MTLLELLDGFYVPLRGVSPRTEKLYRYTIQAYSEHLGHAATVADLEELTVARFLAARVREMAVATAAKDRCQLRALWEFAARRGLTDGRWPQIRPIRVPERVPRCWLTEEMQRLLDAARERQGTIAGVPAAAWWRAALLVCCPQRGHTRQQREQAAAALSQALELNPLLARSYADVGEELQRR